ISVAPTARCNPRPPAFGKTSVLVTGRAAHIQASGIRKSNEQQQRELHTSRSGADRRGDRNSSRTAEAELDPRCPSSTDRRRKPHSSELGARPLARGGTGDKTFAPSCVSYRWAERTRTRKCRFLKSRPNSLVFRNILVPETFRAAIRRSGMAEGASTVPVHSASGRATRSADRRHRRRWYFRSPRGRP